MNNKSPDNELPHDRGAEQQQPEWANGLRQLYNSVVDEPLPDSFKDLLSKLDDNS
ncbi:NepR family anti-sigma factor [Pontixanthobacter sp.]|uniref:NepR family anti-sigma factor n=1 Tax=Pontixanthobacter sp. TaxID=2792078 RepID=UPI003C7C9DA5